MLPLSKGARLTLTRRASAAMRAPLPSTLQALLALAPGLATRRGATTASARPAASAVAARLPHEPKPLSRFAFNDSPGAYRETSAGSALLLRGAGSFPSTCRQLHGEAGSPTGTFDDER